MSDQAIELLTALKSEVEAIPRKDDAKKDAWQRRAEMLIRQIFGPDSKYLEDLKSIHFTPLAFPTSEGSRLIAWDRGCVRGANLVTTMLEELRLFGSGKRSEVLPGTATATSRATSTQVFVVHGHDMAMKEMVARTLNTLGLTPIILHEQPNQGRTIIEKFTDYSSVGFAVVLLTPDDMGRATQEVELRPRARQNVVFELGYFIGKLGRANVLALYRPENEFELPSDYAGVLFVRCDVGGRWKFDLAKELRAAGYQVDANKLL